MTGSAPPKALWIGTILVLMMAAVAWCVWLRLPENHLQPPQISFDGDSSRLKYTTIVPTLDTPVTESRNVVWFGGFQAAWEELRSQLGPEPPRFAKPNALLERLNSATMSPDGLHNTFAAAGSIRSGVVEQIRKEMSAHFPNLVVPELPDGPATALVAFAALNAGIEFTHRFVNYPGGLEFTEGEGGKTTVRAFGISPEQRYTGWDTFREQVKVLYYQAPEASDCRGEFVLDLDRDSHATQVIVARLPWQGTLQKTIDLAKARVSYFQSAKKKKDTPDPVRLTEVDELAVPVMHWRIEHHFRDLEGTDRPFVREGGKGEFLATAMEVLHLAMDRGQLAVPYSGTVAIDRAKLVGRKFHCSGPFLLYLKQRYASTPYFALWVDNDELLLRKS